MDNIELVIKIPKKIYNYIQQMGSMNMLDTQQVANAIFDAKPANEVLDKIRTDVKKKIVKRPWLNFEDRERDRNDAFLEVLDIIDKYKTNL